MSMVTQAIQLLTDEAARLGADAEDSTGAVRGLVVSHGLGFNAWFCVCCELADRKARLKGFRDQADQAAQSIGGAR